MDYRSTYVPKKQKKLSYKIVVPFVLLLVILAYLLITIFNPEVQDIDTSLTVCRMSHTETRSLITKLETNRKEAKIENIVIADYGQYGETLGLYQKPYQVNQRDPMNGKTIFLKNLCTDDESTFLMGVDLDSKIPLEQLEDGFYELEMLSGLDRKRLVSESEIDDTIHTISRNGGGKKIRIIANQTAFDSSDTKILDANVLYLEVVSDPEADGIYDIAIDPSGLTYYTDGDTNLGNQLDDLIEANEMYDVAVALKTKLEAKGLRVLILRDNKTPVDVYGEDGRVARGYKAQAKYYIQLNLLYSGYQSDKGATMIYSNFSTNRMASALMKKINEQTSLAASDFSSGNNIDGVYQTQLIDDMDLMNIIRETGGKFTAAGVHEDFLEINASASQLRKGMQTVVIEYGYLNDAATYKTWITEKEAIINATYEGIIAGLGIE